MSRRDAVIAFALLSFPPVVYVLITLLLLYRPPQARSVQQLIDVLPQLLWPVTFVFVVWSGTVALWLSILLRVRFMERPTSGVSSPAPLASSRGATGDGDTLFVFTHALYHLVTYWAALP